MRYLGDQIKGDRDISRGGSLREADGIVQEDLVRARLDDQGWQARGICEHRADEAEGGVLSRRVVDDARPEQLTVEQRVDAALGIHRGPGQGEVGIR
jgi:hypothetical protein